MKYTFQGLTTDEVLESRKANGSNELSPQQSENFWDKLIGNFKDPIIIILCAALGIMILLSIFDLTEWYEALAIAIAVLLATFVSTYSEFKNESSFQKLQEEALKITCNVFRNKHLVKLPIGEIVVGDYVLLQSGDKIPADGCIIHGELKVNQASLTGESESISKTKIPEGREQSEEKSPSSPHWLFRGAVVDDGEAIVHIRYVGDETVYGQLARELSENQERLSPLQVKLKGLAVLISKFGYIAASLVFVTFLFNKVVVANHFNFEEIVNYWSHWDYVVIDLLEAGILSIIIVVAAVPEGLPMMIAIVLSLNMRKLLKEKVLVRKLLGIETAGSLNILFTDKTGTITKGKFEPKMFISGSGARYSNYRGIPNTLRDNLCFSILENTSCVISPGGDVEGGNLSERALLSFIDKEDIISQKNPGVEAEKVILFNSARKFSATQVKSTTPLFNSENKRLTLIKGSPELLFDRCERYIDENGQIHPLDKKMLGSQVDQLSNDGIRFIAVAFSEETIASDALPSSCTLIGVIGITDEVREESKSSIAEAQAAGVQIVMLTGDKKGTAMAIATEVGLLKNDGDVVLTSEELSRFTDEEVKTLLPALRVIARALPTDKSRLVRIAKEMGKVVGMTGDGVNDSAALKHADVGFAMGSGSEVSKEASDIVIMDDNFNSISNAIRYGRTIFKSIRKFIIFQLTVNVAAVTTVFLGPFFGIEFPLTIIQLLWVNIIMDTLAAIAFGGEPALKRFMHEAPVRREANILTKEMVSAFLVGGIFITVFSLFFLNNDAIIELFVRNGKPNQAVFMTAFFNLFVFMITLNSFNARTDRMNIFENLSKNKNFLRVIALIFFIQILFTYLGGAILRTTPLTLEEWLITFLLSLAIIPVDLFRKLIVKELMG